MSDPDDTPHRDESGRFVVGYTPPGGRPPGSLNRIVAELKQGIVDGAAAYGRDGRGADGLRGWLAFLAAEHPKVHALLIAKLLPRQLLADIELHEPAIVHVEIVTVPRGFFFLNDPDTDPWLYSEAETNALTGIRNEARERAEEIERKLRGMGPTRPRGEA